MRARNRRIFGRNGGLIGIADFTNGCVFDRSTEGIWHGHIDGTSSYTVPTNLEVTGQYVFEFKYSDDGDFIFRLGAAGDEQGTDGSNTMYVKDLAHGFEGYFVWNGATLRYEYHDLDWSNSLIGSTESIICLFFDLGFEAYDIINGINDIVNGTNNIVNPQGG